MKTTRTQGAMWRRFGMTCAFVAGTAIVAPAAKGPAVAVLTFSIDTMEASLPPNAVFSDSPDGYRDYRLTSGLSSDPNHCVEASPDGAGFTFIRLNRKLDGDAGTMYCGLFGGPGAMPRQFSLQITDDTACLDLYSNGYLATYAPGGCVVTGNDKPRIRLPKLYANKVTKTPVVFLIEHYNLPTSYYVQTDTDATVSIVGGSTNNRTVQYLGTARLWKFGVSSVGSAFSLPFHMTFNRSYLAN